MMRLSKISSPSFCVVGLTLALTLVLMAAVPFGHALEIHHLFSEIDHDGHEHSDDDLCQWVQQHTSTSLAWDLPQLAGRSWLYSRFLIGSEQIVLSYFSTLLRSRGPPSFLFS